MTDCYLIVPVGKMPKLELDWFVNLEDGFSVASFLRRFLRASRSLGGPLGLPVVVFIVLFLFIVYGILAILAVFDMLLDLVVVEIYSKNVLSLLQSPA